MNPAENAELVREESWPPGVHLPAEPIYRIRPRGRWVAVDLGELWQHRELLYFLTWRDVKVRYKQTMLGAAWAIIQPLFAMIIFTIFFGRLAGIESDGVPYAVFAYVGLVPWTFFSNALTNSGNSLVGNANLITKVYFPRIFIPGAAVAAGLVDLVIASLVLFGLLAAYRIGIGWGVFMLPLLTLLTVILATGAGMLLSALNVKYRDIRYALPFLIQLWMFLSPVIYPASIVPQRWRWLLSINPMTGIIQGYRSALFGVPFDWLGLGISTVVALALFVYAAAYFYRTEKQFADVV